MTRQILKLSTLVFAMVFPLTAVSDYVFTAPPRESLSQGKEIYQPIADYLSKATGERFVYHHPQNWTEYSRAMQAGEYDLVFDGPHFVSWRVEYINHEVVAKLPQLHIWRVITNRSDESIQNLDDLVGKKVCAPKSPNFGMLTMMSHYPNPDKEPVHVITKGWKDGFNGVVDGKCVATVLPKTNHVKFDPKEEKTRALHTHLPYPNQAFTTSSKITPNLKARIEDKLLSEEGQAALKKLRDRFSRGERLVGAVSEEYEGISMVLKRADNFSSAVKQAR